MHDIHVTNMRDGYVRIVEHVRLWGEEVAPRGQPTLEVQGATIILEDPYDALPVGVGRKLNPSIAAAEAAQLIGGVSYPDLMVRITRNFDRFRDDGTFHGAYGPRVRAQLPAVVQRLKLDPHTRQAIVVLWDPVRDTFTEGLSDYPCTISLQYFIRDGRLEAHTHMRSNDVWWGLAYDAFQFTQLQITVANVLGIEAGRYYHHANSLHFYLRDTAAAQELYFIHDAPKPERVEGFRGPDMVSAMAVARRHLKGDVEANSPVHNAFYTRHLNPYVLSSAA